MAIKPKINIKIEVDADEANREIAGIILRSRVMTPALEKAKLRLEASNAANFAANGLPSGGWSPRRRDYGWPIMKRTGRLMEDVTHYSGPETQMGLTEAQFATSVDYAQFHQYGTRFMAKRQIVWTPVGFAGEVGEDVVDWMLRGR